MRSVTSPASRRFYRVERSGPLAALAAGLGRAVRGDDRMRDGLGTDAPPTVCAPPPPTRWALQLDESWALVDPAACRWRVMRLGIPVPGDPVTGELRVVAPPAPAPAAPTGLAGWLAAHPSAAALAVFGIYVLAASSARR